MQQPNLLLQCKPKIPTRIYQKLRKLIAFQDNSNNDNLEACLSKTSKTLGQCILDCNNDSSCETDCVSTFKDEHSECPCQVCGSDLNECNIIFIGKMSTWLPL